MIKDPVDLSLMERRLARDNFYITLDIFVADFKRMCNNCRWVYSRVCPVPPSDTYAWLCPPGQNLQHF